MNSLRALEAFPMLAMRGVVNFEEGKREGLVDPLRYSGGGTYIISPEEIS